MKIIAVDDEWLALESLTSKLRTAEPDSEIRGFNDPIDALNEINSGAFVPDIAFLDIEMFGMNGLELAKELKELRPEINVIFVTGFSQYAVDAISLRASGYLLKPASLEDIARELENLRSPLIFDLPPSVHISVTTFGNFSISIDGAAVSFPQPKTRELLAYLIHIKGRAATIPELSALLWDGMAQSRSVQKQTQAVISELEKTLAAAGEKNLVCKRHGAYFVNTDMIDCDLYRFLRGDVATINTYAGIYMPEYNWASFSAEPMAPAGAK